MTRIATDLRGLFSDFVLAICSSSTVQPMTWDSHIISSDELLPFLDVREPDEFLRRVRALLQQQQRTWPSLREATAALDQLEYKQFDLHGSTVFAQFNPKRIVSTAAKVDAATISKRPCFLCADNLPVEEKGIAFGEEFVILCNPFPVLRDHLVMTHRQHTPQAIAGHFAALLEMTRALGDEFFTLYNGPACGASAPDHLHFQACNAERLPIAEDLKTQARRKISSARGIEVFTFASCRLNVLIAQSDELQLLRQWFDATLQKLKAMTKAEAEPMLNLIARYEHSQWTVFVFPRSKHRPACYFAEGDAKLTVSPAGIDLSGVIVVPDPSHFARINAADLAAIYREVTLEDERFGELLNL
jgi:ATP adenylyltransferase/5',5'''-P-1,P-4-tetraphosphate phosphorylase II